MGTSRDAAALMSSFDQFKQWTTFLLLEMKARTDIIEHNTHITRQETQINTVMKYLKTFLLPKMISLPVR